MITAKVTVTLKEGVLDPQGKTILNALKDLGYHSVKGISTGRIFRLQIDRTDKAAAVAEVEEICRRLLTNPVIEQFKIEAE